MEKIKITEQIKENAKRLMALTGDSENCCIGEVAFTQYLYENEVLHTPLLEQTDSKNKRHGIILHMQSGPNKKLITATYPDPQCWKMMIPQGQLDKYFDYYIGLKINDGHVEIWGYTEPTGFHLETHGFNYESKPTLWKWLKDLKPISTLLAQAAFEEDLKEMEIK